MCGVPRTVHLAAASYGINAPRLCSIATRREVFSTATHTHDECILFLKENATFNRPCFGAEWGSKLCAGVLCVSSAVERNAPVHWVMLAGRSSTRKLAWSLGWNFTPPTARSVQSATMQCELASTTSRKGTSHKGNLCPNCMPQPVHSYSIDRNQ